MVGQPRRTHVKFRACRECLRASLISTGLGQLAASRLLYSFSRDRVAACASTPRLGHAAFAAADWLSAIPSEAGAALPPDCTTACPSPRTDAVQCGAHGHGSGAAVDAYGNHAVAQDCSPTEPSHWSMPRSSHSGGGQDLRSRPLPI